MVGLSVGLAKLEVKPAGILVHEKESPATLDPPSEILPPEQIAVLAITEAEGAGFTVIETVLVLLQPVPATVSVRIYFAEDAGFTEGLDEVEVNPDGLLVQLYLLPETGAAPIEMGEPAHIVVLAIVLAAGSGLTLMVTDPVWLHPFAESFNVYVVVPVGLTEGLAEVDVNPAGTLVHE